MKLPSWPLASGQQRTQTQTTTSATKCGFQVAAGQRAATHRDTDSQLGDQMWLPIWPPAHGQQRAQKTVSRHGDQMCLPTWPPASGQQHKETQTANTATNCALQSGRRPAGSNTQKHRQPTRRPNVASNLAACQRAATHRDTDTPFGDQKWLPIWPRPKDSNTQRHRKQIRRPNVASNYAAGQRAATHRYTDSQLGDQTWLPIWQPGSGQQHAET